MNSQKVTKELQAPYVSFKKKFNALALADAAKLEAGQDLALIKLALPPEPEWPKCIVLEDWLKRPNRKLRPGVHYCGMPKASGDNRAIPPLIPVGRSSWWAGVKSGRYPKPLKLGPRTTVWRRNEIIKLIDELESESK